MFIATQGSFSQ